MNTPSMIGGTEKEYTMKRKTTFSLALTLFLGASCVVAVGRSMPTAYAQSADTLLTYDNEASPSGSVEAAELSTYVLPYPGILPDHPLYFLKAFRDRIVELLISDPVRKAEFYVLQSDKWLNTALFTKEAKKTEYLERSLRYAVDFERRAVSALEGVKQSGKQIEPSLLEKLTWSNRKHMQILTGIIDGGEDYQGAQAESILRAYEELAPRIDALK